MSTYIFMPPLPKFSGGMAVLVRVAEHMREAGAEAVLVLRERAPLPAGLRVPVMQWEALRLTPEDTWLVPEGWPAALVPGLQAGARCVVYVQNWAYLLGNMPGDNREWSRLPVKFLAVSDPVAWFVEQITGEKPPILRPGIDLSLFHPAPDLLPCDSLRIAWMPRKNKALARQIRCMTEARNRIPVPLEWVEIHDLSQEDVARCLRSSHIFLATGFPEGCPLPPLEALASGCIVAGFSGLGGWDYMRQLHDFPGACVPWWPLRETPFLTSDPSLDPSPAPSPKNPPAISPPPPAEPAGNGFYAADADVPGAVMALEAAASLILSNPASRTSHRHYAQKTAQAYSVEAQADRIQELISRHYL